MHAADEQGCVIPCWAVDSVGFCCAGGACVAAELFTGALLLSRSLLSGPGGGAGSYCPKKPPGARLTDADLLAGFLS